MAERPNEAAERLPIHDLGCRCWPHVSQRDAQAVIEAVGLAEYRDGTRALAAERAAGIDRLAALAVRLANHGSRTPPNDPCESCALATAEVLRLAAQSEEPTP